MRRFRHILVTGGRLTFPDYFGGCFAPKPFLFVIPLGATRRKLPGRPRPAPHEETAMSDLIKGFIYVKDPLTLFAFLSLVFWSRSKPGMSRGFSSPLPEKKLTKEQFSSLLHRFMLYGFGGFVLVCGVAVAGRVLAYASRNRPHSLEDERKEIATRSVSEQQKQAAVRAYSEGLEAVRKRISIRRFSLCKPRSMRSPALLPNLRWRTSTRRKEIRVTQTGTPPKH